jgi:Ca-activated chloride channel homolog
MKTDFLLDYPTILANQARPVHFAIQFVADVMGNLRPRPAAFCAVVDRSGSMEGPPLIHAKAAAKVAVRNLRRDDLFGLVVFDNEARTVIPLQKATNKQSFYDIIDRIRHGGSTNLTGGWMLGRDELCKAEAGTTRRLLLLSDGLLNIGIKEPEAVRQIVIAGLKHDAVCTSCLGFGDKYNEDLLAALAQATNGQFYDADSPETLPTIFAAELDGLQKLCIQNLRIRIQALDFCEKYSQMGEYPSVSLPDGRTEFAVGDLVSEEERIVCFSVQALGLPIINGKPPFDLKGELLLGVEVLWDELLEHGLVSRTLTQQVRIQATQNPAEVVVNRVVAPWISLQKAGAAVADATKMLDQGKINEALAALDKSIQELGQYGERGEEAIKVLQDMKSKISSGEWTLRERKSSRHVSYLHMKMSSRELMLQKPTPPSSNQQPPGEGNTPKPEIKDRRVLSVPAGITYALMTEYNVYSCPDNYPAHDPSVDAFAPRNEEGKIPRLYRIAARIIVDPKNPVFPAGLNPQYTQSITSYISVVKRIIGILDGGGKYRFYILSDVEQGALKHSPSVQPPGPAHLYLSLRELLSGSSVVHAIPYLP